MSGPNIVRELRRASPLCEPRSLVAALGLSDGARRQAAGVVIRCPVHAERVASCSVFVAKDETVAVRCHACGWTGDAIALIAVVRGLDVRRDWARVVEEASRLTNRPADFDPIWPHLVSPLASSTSTCGDDAYGRIWSHVFDALAPIADASPTVAHYLETRGVFEEARAAGLHALPDDPRELVTALLRNFDRVALSEAGVLRRDNMKAARRAWPLLIPWRDRFGRITCVQRRRIDTIEPRYLCPAGRSPRAPFGVDGLSAVLAMGDHIGVVIVEGAIDVLSRRRIAGERGEGAAVIGIYSASSPCVGLPRDLLAGRRVVLAVDADEAGERASAALAHDLGDVAGKLIRERPPGGAKDWNATIVEPIK